MLKILSFCALAAGILAFGRREMAAIVQHQKLEKIAYEELTRPAAQSCSTVDGSFAPAPGSTAPCPPDPLAALR